MIEAVPAGSATTVQPPVAALRRAAVRATLAPSVHNTQPWSLLLGEDSLCLFVDRERQLRVLDPAGRQLLISIGCALLNARVSLAADGYRADVARSPGPARHGLVATLSAVPGADSALAALDPVIGVRRTNRRPFARDEVPSEVLDRLAGACSAEGATTMAITERAARRRVMELTREAEGIELADPAYRAELRAWVGGDSARTDGVPLSSIPGPPSDEHAALPIRGFDPLGRGGLEVDEDGDGGGGCLMVLGSDRDDPSAWVRTGEALERCWLEATRQGFALSLFTQVVEVASTRARLQRDLGVSWQPLVVVRVGRAAPTPATRRRRLVEVLHQAAPAPSGH